MSFISDWLFFVVKKNKAMWDEIISHCIFGRVNRIRSLCHLSCTNKANHTILKDNVWLWHHAVLSTCGTPLTRDSHYHLKLHVCPWLSFPNMHVFDFIAPEWRLKGVRGMRFEGEDSLIVTLYLERREDYAVFCKDVVICVSTFEIRYGLRMELVGNEEYSPPKCGLRFLDLAGKSLRIDVPEEIVCSCRGELGGIRCVVLHDGVVALHAGTNYNTSDVYIFANSGRLLRRLHVSRDAQEVMVCCKGSAMAVLQDNYDGTCRLQLYAPEVEGRIVLRRKYDLV